ncbi:hypothetical protein [Granulicella tundricola]|uniref:Uncharacterized protein n=1 Tax=Granulicella tundricola (strain ATCC BAA-1859 / DSM 23138 / MP5ACTX9) TaxID=1198114 RepID=E8X543_GRATM|nr:hypothetical protein [Granulicella tundricola]ADW68307.1 hypothetical protein AciX9_1245 [Granulicella tundricola MP5ACTX9]
MHLDRGFLNSMEGHHLIAAYALVVLIQGGYVGWIAYTWRKIGKPQNS